MVKIISHELINLEIVWVKEKKGRVHSNNLESGGYSKKVVHSYRVLLIAFTSGEKKEKNLEAP